MGRGRRPNSAETIAVTLSATTIVRALLEVVAEDGTYGKNAAEVANALLGEKLRELRKGGDILADRLNEVQRSFHAEHNKGNE